MRSAILHRSFAVTFGVLFSACGGTTGLVAGDGGGSGGGCGAVTGPGEKVVRECDVSVAVHNAGDGFGVVPPPGSNCRGDTYTLTLATRQLSWSGCDTTAAPWVAKSGERVLLANEYQALFADLETVTVSTRSQCGADKSTETLTVVFPGGSQVYWDDFYSCNGGNEIYVANIDTPRATMSTLARQ